MNWLWFSIAAFATYYSARSIAEMDGPFGVFDKLRLRFNAGYLGKGIRCVVCVSAYTGLVFALLLGVVLGYDGLLWPVVWLGLAGASVTIDKVWKR